MRDDSEARVEDDTWRLFIAFPLPSEWTEGIAVWQQAHLAGNDRLRLITGANLHVTLVFLGEVSRAATPAIEQSVRGALATQRAPSLSVAGIATTRSVVMLRLKEPEPIAARLQRELVASLARQGIEANETRPWAPHVTVARHRGGRRLKLAAPAPTLSAWSPSEVAVIHSRLHTAGVRYEIVQSLPIGGSRG